MALTELAADGVRCLKSAELRLSPNLNLVFGANGAGKTSVLEAAFLLGRARSFRTRIGERLIRHGAERLWVFGRNDKPAADHGGLEIDRKSGSRAKLNGIALTSYAELAEAFPVQVIDAEIHKLVEEGSARRRRWLDWAVFHVEHPFTAQWSSYSRALRQRNAALQAGEDQRPWDAELCRLGEELSRARSRFFEAFYPYWQELEASLLGLELQISFTRGWPSDQSMAATLLADESRDKERGTTTHGAHRADLQLRIGRYAARDVLSRGQQKLAAVAMTLAQLQCLQANAQLSPTLLLDDPAAELDARRLQLFIARVGALKVQRIVTSLSADFRVFGDPDQVFHVEHGELTTL
jgi:DNA replication and repair protein RecF